MTALDEESRDLEATSMMMRNPFDIDFCAEEEDHHMRDALGKKRGQLVAVRFHAWKFGQKVSQNRNENLKCLLKFRKITNFKIEKIAVAITAQSTVPWCGWLGGYNKRELYWIIDHYEESRKLLAEFFFLSRTCIKQNIQFPIF